MDEQPKLKLPDNFKTILMEVVSPMQSCEYMTLGDTCFPIQVLSIGMEKKFLRLARTYIEYPDKAVSLTVGELCHFYYPELRLNWPMNNASEEEINAFHQRHLEKLSYNDDVIGVVAQVIDLIEWKPPDEKRREEFKHYLGARIFTPIFSYMNIIENARIDYVFNGITRGYLELVKLNNMITNDRMSFTADDQPKVTDSNQDKMAKAGTAEEYLAGLTGQGFDISSMF